MKRDIIIRVEGREEISKYLGKGAVIDDGAVEGKEVVEVARNRAKRAFLRGENVSSSLEMETLLYVAGVRQINRALEIAGVKGSTKRAYVVLFSSAEAVGAIDEEEEGEEKSEKGFERIALLEVYK
jgi:tRNA threonylcarbamoyladenosine modification (KEOPS) complex Cgi121 subunit